jgi:dihydroflavonol-4-reductase
VVYTSSIAAIGIAPGRELSTEATPFNQYTLGNHYVLTKYLSQQEALGFARNGLDLVVVNPAFPFGPRDIVPTPTGQMIVDILKGKNRFCFDGGLNVVDVRDVARGHVLAARRGRTGERYILGNSNLTLHELMLLVYRAAGIPPGRIVRVPVALARLGAAGMTLWANRVSHRPPVSSPPEIDYSAQYLFFDTSKARGELGLRPRPVEESIAEAISFFRANGYV